jgi:translation elongation factor P/translation initiation factor 5A
MFNVVINNEQYDEYLTQKEKIKELEARIKETDVLKARIDSLYEDYQQALSDKAALIKERWKLLNENNKIREELKSKESIDTITINTCRDLEEAYSPDSNTTINIKNLYLTNNYFSEEDESNGSK